MHYNQIIEDCISDGPGVRVSLYVSGCRNHCKGCHNPNSWDFNFGEEFTEEIKNNILNYLSKPYIAGLTLCGGEPLEPENQIELIKLCKEVKNKFPEKTIWCYTGYEWENIKDSNILNYIDVVVVSKFVLNLRDITINNLWRGSTNQRVIDVKESLKQNKKVYIKNIPNND